MSPSHRNNITNNIPADKNIAIEFIKYGNAVKVTAINLDTGQEASIIGSPAYSKQYLSNLAVKKLNYINSMKNKDN